MKKNIDFINRVIVWISNELDAKNIDFYIVGAIGAYIDASLPIQRNHDDLDILIQEKDVSKLKEVFKDTDFDFFDNRFISDKWLNEYGYPDGNHEVYAKYRYDEFHIGFFLYKVEKESYTIIEYFRQDGAQKRLDRTLPLEMFKYHYNNMPGSYLNKKIKVVRKELIYKNKLVMNRDKDLYDIKRIEPYLDKTILNELKKAKNKRITKIINI